MSYYGKLCTVIYEYNQRKEEMDSGKAVDTLELSFIGHALDAVDLAKNNCV